MMWQGNGCIKAYRHVYVHVYGLGVSCIRYRILREFLGLNFVSGLRTLKPKKLLKKL